MVKHEPKALKIGVLYLLGPKSPVKFEHFGKKNRQVYEHPISVKMRQ